MAWALWYYLWKEGGDYTAIINVWICWSETFENWSCLIIDQIYDYSSKRFFYPDNIVNWNLLPAKLITIWSQQKLVWKPEAIDMEWSAFFENTSKFVWVSRSIIIKIVSDQNTSNIIDKNRALKLITSNFDRINTFIDKVKLRMQRVSSPKISFDDYLISRRFTVTQRRQFTNIANKLINKLHYTQKQILRLVSSFDKIDKKNNSLAISHLETILKKS